MTDWNGFAINQTLSVLVHAHSKVGKTWFGASTPAPRLILDAEGGTNWIPGTKVYWDPMVEPPPVTGAGRPAPGADPVWVEWDTCITMVREQRTVATAYQWLVLGQHMFRSVTLDSVSEIQKRAKDEIGGAQTQWDQQKWGLLLAQMEELVRNMRDLTTHPTNPVQAVVIVAFTRQVDGRHVPYVQGALGTSMPYFLDVIGYLFPQRLEDGSVMRRLLVSPDPMFEAGERVGGRLPPVVDNPNVEQMLHTVYDMQPTGLYAPTS